MRNAVVLYEQFACLCVACLRAARRQARRQAEADRSLSLRSSAYRRLLSLRLALPSLRCSRLNSRRSAKEQP